MDNFVALSPANNGSFFFPSNMSSVNPYKVVSLADNNISHVSYQNYNGTYNFNLHFNPPSAIVIIALLCLLFFIGFFFIFMWRRWMNRASRVAGVSNNVRLAATGGMDKMVVESFPLFSYNLVKGLETQANLSQCAVCLAEFQEEMMLRLLPICSHAFHPECIDTWLYSHTTCPVCRTSLLPGEESNATARDPDVVTLHMPPEQVSDNGGNRIDISNKELQQPSQRYISTPGGLSYIFVAMNNTQGPSTSNSHPACSNAGGSIDDAGRASR